MKQKILIIDICKEKLHYYEFVKPIKDILKKNNIKNFVKNYKKITKKDLTKISKVIICGTSLKDNEFIKYFDKFRWILNFNQPILGICGGVEIIGLIFGGKLKRKTEIGYYKENFEKDFLSLKGSREVYHLHNYYIDFKKLKEFDVFSKNNKIPQAVKHKEKPILGVLFHPEVRHKDLIKKFAFL